jgi:transposase
MGVFLTPGEKRESQGPSVKDMQAKIGQLALENDFLAGALGRIDGASAKK